nr:unnamed protein product [Spirometra erinaceieuropaei]
MVSFDVTSLFTSITQDSAIETVELLLRSKYNETTNRLGHAQVLQFLKFCVRAYFTFDGTMYEQVKGTPMGSPISGFIAEAVLKRLESLAFQHHTLKFWARRNRPPDSSYLISMSMFRAVILLALLASVFGTEDFDTAPNSNFVNIQPFPQRPQSITIGGQTVPEGSLSNPCEVGISCWQPLTDKQFSYLSARPVNGTGIIILVPAAGIRLSTAVIVRHIGENLQAPTLPVVVGKIVNLDINTTAEREFILLYSEDVKDTIFGGNIHKFNEAGPPIGKNVLHIPYLDETVKGHVFALLTGHLDNTTLEYTFKLNASTSDLVRMVPAEGRYPPRVVRVSFSGEPPLRLCKILIFAYSVISFLAAV